ncbi:phage tail tip lysozyme [Roseiarcus sp.]|uniref:phage tail tip lysozyme n=1 Tax=Roseiarcus sp. TaxID=1969460 RepID=UPI003F978585
MSVTLPEWPDESTPEGVTFFGAAHAIVAAWKTNGIGNAFALAMLTMAEAESGLNPNALGDYVDSGGKLLPWSAHPTGTPTAFGLYQRHGDRLKAIKAALGVDILAAVLAGRNLITSDIEAAWWELNTFSWAGKKAIKSASTAYMAAYQACALFERAGAPDAADRRGVMAERWAVYFQKNGF